MIYFVQACMLTLIEALSCKIFCDVFLQKKDDSGKWKSLLYFGMLLAGFMAIALFSFHSYIWKALATIIVISVVTYLQYKGNWLQIIFLSIGYYGLLVCIDRIMILVFPVTIVVALLSKAVLFLLIILFSKTLKPKGSLNLITNKEWLHFLFFPMITVICMTAFAVEGGSGYALLIVSFALIFSNYLVFYMIRDVVAQEKEIQEMLVSQERIRNQLNMHRQIESVYEEQRKKAHEFKNSMNCLHGLLKTKNYREAEAYIEKINHNWIEEIDYINTNHAVINSVLNQKIKYAKKKGIPILFVVNNLENVRMADTDLVTLLSNLLDNAIEACEKIATGSKVIKMRFVDENGKVVISVRNPVAEPLKYQGDTLVTSKKEEAVHGIGLVNIQNVVSKYGGENIWSCHDGYFTHSVVLDFRGL
ncbi:MAG: GHKL domain-containing protein [Candidatus Gastranaerophilales bacterium]|nr:GHKL domain-containing protein [Candidatus Gastranaerophilales bacterium]